MSLANENDYISKGTPYNIEIYIIEIYIPRFDFKIQNTILSYHWQYYIIRFLLYFKYERKMSLMEVLMRYKFMNNTIISWQYYNYLII